MSFLKSVKFHPVEMSIQSVEMSIQPVVLHSVDFEKNLKSLTLF